VGFLELKHVGGQKCRTAIAVISKIDVRGHF